MNQDNSVSDVIIIWIGKLLKNKLFLLAFIIIVLFNGVMRTNSLYKSTCKLSPLFVKEMTSQIIEIDEIVKLDICLELDNLEEYSKNLMVSAYVGGTSEDEKQLSIYMNDFRQIAYDVSISNEIIEQFEMSRYNDIKLVLMYELNSKRKSYSELEALWDLDIFTIE